MPNWVYQNVIVSQPKELSIETTSNVSLVEPLTKVKTKINIKNPDINLIKEFREKHFKTRQKEILNPDLEERKEKRTIMVDSLYFDFNTFIPMPEDLNISETGSAKTALMLLLEDPGEYLMYQSSSGHELYRANFLENKHIADNRYSIIRDIHKKLLVLAKDKANKADKVLQEYPYILMGDYIELIQRYRLDINPTKDISLANDPDKRWFLYKIDFEMGKKYLENQLKYGHRNWYSWSIKNWGTKWNAANLEIHSGDDETDVLNFSFDTAWSLPEPIYNKMFEMYPGLYFDVEFYEESFLMAGYISKEAEEEAEWVYAENVEAFVEEHFGITPYSDED